MPLTIGIRANAPPHIPKKSASGLRIADAPTASQDCSWFDWICPARRLTIQRNHPVINARRPRLVTQVSRRIHVTRSKSGRSQKLAAGVFRDLIEPSAVSSAGTINL